MAVRGSILGVAVALLWACQPKEVEIRVNIVTSSCESATPLENVTHLKVRVMAADLTPPIEAVSIVSAEQRELRIPDIPAGPARVVEVRAYRNEPNAGGAVVSMGRTLPFDVPDALPERPEPIEVNVFLRRVNMFTRPNTAVAPNTCSKMGTPRAGHTATLLPSGKVLVAGGYTSVVLDGGMRVPTATTARTELFNPNTGLFEEGPDVGVANSQRQISPLPRAFHTATLLKNGQVLVWGGERFDPGSSVLQASVLIYDPTKNQFAGIPPQYLERSVARAHHAAVLDQAGRVLIVGGWGVESQPGGGFRRVVEPRVEWFDPATTKGAIVQGEALPRLGMSAQAVKNGQFIGVAGGHDGTRLTDEVVFFTFDGGGFSRVATQQTLRLRIPRRAAGAALLRDARDVLLVGGYGDQNAPESSSEIVATGDQFNVASGPPIATARGDICTAVLPDGRVLAIGGRSATGSDRTVEILVPQSGGSISVLEAKHSLPSGRYHHTCTTLADGSVLVLGGVKDESGQLEVLQDALIYTPEPLDP